MTSGSFEYGFGSTLILPASECFPICTYFGTLRRKFDCPTPYSDSDPQDHCRCLVDLFSFGMTWKSLGQFQFRMTERQGAVTLNTFQISLLWTASFMCFLDDGNRSRIVPRSSRKMLMGSFLVFFGRISEIWKMWKNFQI